MMKKIIAALLLLITYGLLQTTNSESISRNTEIFNPPQSLLESLHQGIYLESYIQQVMLPVRAMQVAKLDSPTIDEYYKKAMKLAIQKQFAHLAEYDMNHDQNITRSEAEELIILQNNSNATQEHIKSISDDLFRYDTDKNNIISLQEMIILNSQYMNSSLDYNVDKIKQYLLLDPNKDGVLTINELETVARNTFNNFDKNKDGQISSDEMPSKQQMTSHSFPSNCKFTDIKFPHDMLIYGVGSNEGRYTPYQIDKSGNSATIIDITITEEKKPIALILTSRRPTIWNIKYLPNTKIIAVAVGGNDRQVIEGLPKNVALLANESEKERECGRVYFSEDELDGLNPLAMHLFKKRADMFFPVSRKGKITIGAPEFDESKLIQSSYSPEQYHLKGALLAGKHGIAQAIKQGLIRPATQEDVNQWIDVVIEKSEPQSNETDLPPIAGRSKNINFKIPPIDLNNAYVILKPLTFPVDLSSGGTFRFIIPKDTPKPKGDSGFANIYDMNTGKCTMSSGSCHY